MLPPNVKRQEFQLPNEVPPSLSSEIFDAPEGMENDEAIVAIKRALAVARTSAEGALKAARSAHRNAMLTEAAQHRSARDSVTTITKTGCQAIDRATTRVNEIIRQLEASTHAPLPPKDAVTQIAAASIVSGLLAMEPKKRSDTIMASIKSGDDRVVQAVLCLPGFASGLDPLEADHFREQWRRVRLPGECRRLDEIKKAKEHLDLGGRLLIGFLPKLYSHAEVAAGEKSEQDASKALSEARQAQIDLGMAVQ